MPWVIGVAGLLVVGLLLRRPARVEAPRQLPAPNTPPSPPPRPRPAVIVQPRGERVPFIAGTRKCPPGYRPNSVRGATHCRRQGTTAPRPLTPGQRAEAASTVDALRKAAAQVGKDQLRSELERQGISVPPGAGIEQMAEAAVIAGASKAAKDVGNSLCGPACGQLGEALTGLLGQKVADKVNFERLGKKAGSLAKRTWRRIF